MRSAADQEISIGDYVLSGGEVARDGADRGGRASRAGRARQSLLADEESFADGLLEYPHYTCPEEFRGMRVPEVLLSGDHQKIDEWRKAEALKRTARRRPDLLKRRRTSPSGPHLG